MKLSKDEVLRINFRYSPPKENLFRNSIHYIKDNYPGLVRIIKRAGLRNYAPPPPALKCNFSCSYCLVKGMRKHPFSEAHFNQTKLIWDYLSGIEDKILVRINFDGETLADEWAMKCALYVNNISNVKICELFTNNSIDPRSYVDKFHPEKTVFNCSYHSEYMSLGKFLEHIDILRQTGYRVIANLVITPDLIKDLSSLCRTFKGKDIHLRPILLIGFYNGQVFPHDYSFSELECIRKYYYSEFEFDYALGKSPMGLDCYAGVDMLGVYLDGTVKRCNIVKIGHVHDIVMGKIKLKQEPYPCPHNDCMNYCHMMGLKEFREKFIMSDEYMDFYYPKE